MLNLLAIGVATVNSHKAKAAAFYQDSRFYFIVFQI